MTIRLQTSLGRDIPNDQEREISAVEKNWADDIPVNFNIISIRTQNSTKYNCHGLTFASRRTSIRHPINIQAILQDDNYQEIDDLTKVRPGDIIVYQSEPGDYTHSGIVVDHAPLSQEIIVCSKWGCGPEVLHVYHEVPKVYGAIYRFLRCKL